MKTRNPTNNLRHWRTLKREADEQKAATMLSLTGVTSATWLELAKGCHVKLTRISAGTLDEAENLRIAMKHVKDIIAQFLFGGSIGQRDDDKRASWEFCQLKAKRGVYGVIISIRRNDGTHSENCQHREDTKELIA